MTGTALAGSAVTIKCGTAVLGTVFAGSNGAWTYTLTSIGISKIGQGSGRTITATATANSNTSAPFTFAVDTVAPAITSVTDGTHSPNITPGGPYTLTLTFSENVTATPGTTLKLSGSAGDATYVSGSGTKTLMFIYSSSAWYQNVQVTGVDTGSLTDGAGNPVTGYNDTICFTPGTRIATPAGEACVEALRIGDLVTTAEGEAKPVVWIGCQTVSRVFADPLRVLPVRITAGALDENLPARDLLVSPDHALLVDGVLIQAGALVNDSTIRREQDVPTIFTYYHVELADHVLLLAEGVPAETFVDNVDRMAFDNWDEHLALYPQGLVVVELALPRAKSHRQVPMATRARLA